MNDQPLTAATAWGEPGHPAPGATPRANLPEYTVSELSAALKRSIEENFSFVRVRGEISGWKRVASGHCYFALKDVDAVIDAVCWRMTAIRLAVKPEDGMEVVCNGRLTTYPGRSKYQLVIDSIELAGIGALLKLLEDRRQRLAAEGLFAAERKKKPSFLPAVIGIVTSPTGAVIRDILHRLSDRFPRHVLLWPVAVQGEAAAPQVAAAIEGFNRIAPGGLVPRPDLIIVARGGGSLEDLMAFNEEIVVRAAAASAIPLISAVGHETDTTLIDHASDRRAPTPTAAAEMAVPVRLDLIAELGGKAGRLAGGLSRLLSERRLRLEGLGRGLPDPRDLLGAATQRLDDRAERLRLAIAGRFAAARSGLEATRFKPAALATEITYARVHFSDIAARLDSAAIARISSARSQLAASRLRPAVLAADITRAREHLDDVLPRLATAAARFLAEQKRVLDGLCGRLQTLSEQHEDILRRGYVLVHGGAGLIKSATEVSRLGTPLELEFHDGKVDAVAGSLARPRRGARRAVAASGQGDLF